MLYYPQLTSGALTQYPIRRTNVRRSIVNQLADGSTIYLGDDTAAEVRWDLTYSHLTDDESGSLAGLFEAVQGAWQTFTFLDPMDNLLSWSEDLSQPVWKADPLVALAGGVADPSGGLAATKVTNAGQVKQQFEQTLAAPGWYQYCFSIYLRADQATSVDLIATNGSDIETSTRVVGPNWLRPQLSFAMGTKTDGVSVGLRLGVGTTVFAFGLQLEAQPGAGKYKKTRDRAGVYPRSRFDQTSLKTVATGLNQNACSAKVVSRVAG